MQLRLHIYVIYILYNDTSALAVTQWHAFMTHETYDQAYYAL